MASIFQSRRQESISAIKNHENEHILYIVVRKYNLEPLPWKPIKRQPYDITKIKRIGIHCRYTRFRI